VNHPAELLEYYINDSEVNLIITTPEFEEKLKPVAEKLKKSLQVIEAQKLIQNDQAIDEETLISSLPSGSFYKKSPALIMYTSGTTSKPKGR
jgi:acyl-coenzyme A synthetase/AMP-(fatty) acid ligase